MKCPIRNCQEKIVTTMTGRRACPVHGYRELEDRNDEKVGPAAVVVFVIAGLALALAVLWRLLK